MVRRLACLALFALCLLAGPATAQCLLSFELDDGRTLASLPGPLYAPGDYVHFDTYDRSRGGLTVQITGKPLHAWQSTRCYTTFPAKAVDRSQVPAALYRPKRR